MKLEPKSFKIPHMALKTELKGVKFGVGDKIRVVQRIKEAEKSREAYFEGMVIGIKGRGVGRTFRVRKIAEGGIGVERIFPFDLPTIDRIILVKEGMRGVKRAKLYFTREKPPTEVEMIFKRAQVREAFKKAKKPVAKKKVTRKPAKTSKRKLSKK